VRKDVEVESMTTKRHSLWVGVLLAMFIVILAAACGGGDADSAEPAPPPAESATLTFDLPNGQEFVLNEMTAAKVRNGDELNFAYVSFATTSPFWSPVKQGLADADAEYGVSTQFVGPEGPDAEEQVNLIRTLLRSGIDGLITVNPDPTTLGPVIDEAIAEGVPVFTSNIDAPDSSRIAFVGQELVDSGQAAGEEFIRALDQKRPGWQDEQITAATIAGDPAASYAQDRFKGFAEVLSGYPNIEVLELQNSTYDPSEVFSVVDNIFKANPDSAGLYSADSGHVYACQFFQRSDLQDEIVNVGFNFEEGTKECMEAGAIDASVGQFPYRQGYEPVQYLVELLRDGVVPECAPDCYVGNQTVNQSNYQDFDFESNR
jgi:ABC-type sugar transport system substrate-binding protein